MKKVVSVLLIAAFLCALIYLPSDAADKYTFTRSADNNGYVLVKYDGNEVESVIPGSYNGLPVTGIGEYAFTGNISTYKITIPEGVSDISPRAFIGMPSLHEFEAAGTYTAADGVLFKDGGKTLVSFPQARSGEYVIGQNVETIKEYAFYRSSLSDVTFNSKITSIPEYAFYGSSLRAVSIPPSVTTVSAYAFSSSLIAKATLKGAAIYGNAFSDCENLVYADIGTSDLFGEGTFCGCVSLVAFRYGKTGITVPKNTFSGCTRLAAAPSYGFSSVAENAFYGCPSLLYAYIKPSASVSGKAFENCDRLNIVYSEPDTITVSDASYTVKVNSVFIPGIVCPGEYELYTDSSCITVNGREIKAVREGAAEVYAVSRKGGRCVPFTVIVNDGDAVLETNHPYEKGTYTFSKTVNGASRTAVTFASSFSFTDGDTLTVTDSNGNVYGRFSGNSLSGKTLFVDGNTVVLTVSAASGGAYGFRAVSIKNANELTKMTSISMPSSIEIDAGETVCLNASPVPSAAYPDEIVYVSSDSHTATVDGDGNVTALNGGTAVITAYSSSYGVSAVCTVTVRENIYNGFVYEIKDGEATIVYYKGNNRNCVIPSEINGVAVTKIGDAAFAFSDIRTVRIPKSVKRIANDAFDGCASLTAFDVESGGMYFSSENGFLLNYNKSILIKVPCGIKGSVKIPDSVTNSGVFAFDHCYYVTEIDVNNASFFSSAGVKYCASLINYKCSGSNFKSVNGVLYSSNLKTLTAYPPALLAESFSVPNGTTAIGEGAFNTNPYLKKVIIPASVSKIDTKAFMYQNALSEISVSTDNTVFRSFGGVLYEGETLRCVPAATDGSLTVRAGTKEIGRYAFYGCGSITSVILPGGLEKVGAYAFGGCKELRLIIYPDSVALTEQNAFDGCGKLSLYIPDNIEVEYDYGCRVLCGKATPAEQSCINKGVTYSYAYVSSDNGVVAVTETKVNVKANSSNDAETAAIIDSQTAFSFTAYRIGFEHDGMEIPCGSAYIVCENTLFKDNAYILKNGILTTLVSYDRFTQTDTGMIIAVTGGEESREEAALKTAPSKTLYYVNDELDLTGIEVYYTDPAGFTTVIKDGFEAEYDFSSHGTKTVKVIYGDVFVTYDVTVKDSRITGSVKITGSFVYGQIVTCDLTDVKPAGATVGYQWFSGGAAVENAASDSYTIGESDIGKEIKVAVTGTGDYTGTLESVPVIADKAAADPPARPKVLLVTSTSVTLEATPGCEYRMSGTSKYSDSTVFTGLKPGTNYTFYQRKKETATHYPSERVGVTVTTKAVDKLESDVYRLNESNRMLSLVSPQTTVDAFLKNIKNKENVKVYMNGKQITGSALVGTGAELRLYSSDGAILDSYIVAMTGDINGDGKISMTDYLQIKERIVKNKTLNTENEYACDVNGDGKITMTDYLRLKYCIQGHENLIQNEY